MKSRTSNASARTAWVLFSDGFEEIETLTAIDVLRRAGVTVTTASPGGGRVVGAHGVAVEAERRVAELPAGGCDALVLPGGMPNSRTLATDADVQRVVKAAHAAGAIVAAICAAPLALKAAGVLGAARFTSHPSVAAELASERYSTDRVVRDGRLLTSRGPGTALEWSLELVRMLCGDAAADAVGPPMLFAAPARG